MSVDPDSRDFEYVNKRSIHELVKHIRYFQKHDPPSDFTDAVGPNMSEADHKRLWDSYRLHVLTTADPYDFCLRIEHFKTWSDCPD